MSSKPIPGPTGQTLLLGVEGGGTKTVACIATALPDGEFQILGRGSGGPSNMQSVGFDQAVKNLQQAIHQARIASHLPREPVAAACFVMAGVDRLQEESLLRQWATSHRIANTIQVANDTVGLLAAGTPDGWGIGLIAGTGSIALGTTPDGTTARTGGWGYLLGDEGSAYLVALEGLRAAVRSADGRAASNQLLPAFLDRLELNVPDDLLEAVYRSGLDRAGIAGLADVVTTAASEGDPTALRILETAAEELALLVITTARKLKLEGGPIPFCLTGGLILNTPELQNLVTEKLAAADIRISDCVPVDEPVLGAFQLAGRLLEGPS